MTKSLLALTFIFLLVFSACKKTGLDSDAALVTLEGKLSPDGFDYVTTKNVSINVRLLTRDNKPVAGVLTSVYYSSDVREGSEIAKVISDKEGNVKANVVIPSYMEDLVIDPSYVGLLRKAKVKINDQTLNFTIGGNTGYVGDLIKPAVAASSSSVNKVNPAFLSSTTYLYNPANFDALGRPLNLEPVDGTVNFVRLMQEVNASLPERKDGIYANPHYIASGKPGNLNLTKQSDVWITFVHEGANFRNSLGYYTYPTGNKPTSAAAIGNVTMVFPNASLAGHTGPGNMIMGDKVNIGNFPAGTSIGFVLIQNAYNSNGTLNTSATKFYSDESFNNIEPDASLRRHSVLLYSQSQDVFLIGFEDIRRDIVTSDNDFNDLVFFAQTSPRDAIDPTDIPVLESNISDSDGDGVPDAIDEFPADPARAYTRFYPNKNTWGTLVFEDQWPLEGDYDFNDFVLSYRYKFVMNAQNMVVDVVSELNPLAAGAVFTNGFGIELPVSASAVRSVSGYNHTLSYINLNSNGTESGQTNAVIIPFDNVRALFNRSQTNGAFFLNTYMAEPKYIADAVKVTTTFNTPQYEASIIGKAPFNPFVISNVTNNYNNPTGRGKEIHLPNNKPTALANTTLFSTGADSSNPSTGKYYITTTNRPFGLNIAGPFEYPVEKTGITTAYNHFAAWALSGGVSFKDWYLSKPGYRNNQDIYTK